jgi:hypothetical protein
LFDIKKTRSRKSREGSHLTQAGPIRNVTFIPEQESFAWEIVIKAAPLGFSQKVRKNSASSQLSRLGTTDFLKIIFVK